MPHPSHVAHLRLRNASGTLLHGTDEARNSCSATSTEHQIIPRRWLRTRERTSTRRQRQHCGQRQPIFSRFTLRSPARRSLRRRPIIISIIFSVVHILCYLCYRGRHRTRHCAREVRVVFMAGCWCGQKWWQLSGGRSIKVEGRRGRRGVEGCV